MTDTTVTAEAEALAESPQPPEAAEPKGPSLRILRVVPVIVILGLLVHFVLPRLGTIQDSVATMRKLSPWLVGLACACEAVSYLANGALLQSVVRLTGSKLSLRRAVVIELAAGTVALVAAGALGFGAAIYRWTRQAGVSADAALLASWLPSVFDAITLIVFGLLSALELLLMHSLSRTTMVALFIVVSLLTVAIGGIIVLLVRSEWMMALAVRATKVLKRFRPRSSNRGLINAAARASSTWQRMQRGGWLRPAACSLLILAMDVGCLYCAFLAAGTRLPPTVLIAGYGVPLLLGRSSMLPGGIAVIEVAMTALYGGLGVPANIAVVAVLTYRLISFWLPALIGIPMAVTLHSRRHQIVAR
jgi:uncharacterized protein (TIRG00374 family)